MKKGLEEVGELLGENGVGRGWGVGGGIGGVGVWKRVIRVFGKGEGMGVMGVGCGKNGYGWISIVM